MYTTLISVDQLDSILNHESLVIVDCRYDLMNHTAGKQQYDSGHILHARFADVHDDLSGPPVTDSGRHPLPSEDALNELFSRLGIQQRSQVVVYDASSGAFAARLWWLLRYMGHESVALLDGGWPAWYNQGLPVSDEIPTVAASRYQGKANADWLVTLNSVEQAKLLIDSREPARYRGEVEPIDKRAGHIPGAWNHFWKNNLTDDGKFYDPIKLRSSFIELFGEHPCQDIVFYCGSGVTACHNLLAVQHAGLGAARLYAGSWSEWCSDPDRAIATDDG